MKAFLIGALCLFYCGISFANKMQRMADQVKTAVFEKEGVAVAKITGHSEIGEGTGFFQFRALLENGEMVLVNYDMSSGVRKIENLPRPGIPAEVQSNCFYRFIAAALRR